MQENGAAKITLSVGADGRGPRTVGEINTFGMSFALYQAWMYMAVFGASKTFRPSELLPFLAPFDIELQPFLTYAFLVSSALGLIAIALASKKLWNILPTWRMAVAAALVSVAGTALVAAGGPLGVPGVIFGGALMGIGAAIFLIRWGVAFSRFRFATIVINATFSFALGFILAIALVNWVPAPFTGLLAILMPLLMIVAFHYRHATPIETTNESIKNRYLRGYLVRLVVCLAFFGLVMGALRAICGTQLLSYSEVAIELVLATGCFVSIIVLMGAMITTKQETSWDSLFRFISPIIALGIAGLALLLGDMAILGCFIVSLGYVCLEALLWIFLANMAKSLNGSAIFVIGLGYGVLQAFSIGGVAMESLLVGSANALTDMALRAEMSDMALILLIGTAFGYAVLPRYRELKAVLAAMIHGRLQGFDASAEGAASLFRTSTPEEKRAIATEAMLAAQDTAATRLGETAVESRANKAAPPDQEAKAAADGLTGSGAESEQGAHRKTAKNGADEESTAPDHQDATVIMPSLYTISPLVASSVGADNRRPEKGSFMRRCDEIVSTYLLSEREREVLVLLAKGHNAAFIQDQLCISRSTAKTHINHIYKKLDIHTQQELLRMVEDRKRGPGI